MSETTYESELVTFEMNEEILEDVLCDFIVEDSNWQKISFTTKDNRITKLFDKDKIQASVKHTPSSGKTYKKVEIFDSYVGTWQTFWRQGRDKYTFTLHPKNALTRQLQSEATPSSRCDLDIFINEAPAIKPHTVLRVMRNGDIKQNKAKPSIIKLDSGLKLNIDLGFDYDSSGKKFTIDSYTIIRTRINKKRNFLDKIKKDIIPEVDRFIELVSLIHGERVFCKGWRCTKNNEVIYFHRSNLSSVRDIESNDFSLLVRKKHASDFLNHSITTYVNSPHHDALRNAINTLLLPSGMVLEMTFLAYFQALECLILSFRRLNGLELTFNDEQFKEIKRKIKKSIDSSIIPDPSKRMLIKEKIDELNRPSIKNVTTIFFNEINIITSDLWPLFDSIETTGLSTLRNKIIHGDTLPKEAFEHLIAACEHARVYIQRIILNLLHWDLDKSNISVSAASKFNSYFEKNTYEEASNNMTVIIRSKT